MRARYPFSKMVMMETRLILGDPATIRTAASMIGKRKALWFTCRTVEGGVVVQRVDSPPRIKDKAILIEKQLKMIESSVKLIRSYIQ